MQDRHWWNKSLKPQVPPLRYASVGMTKGGVVTFIRSCQIGWTEKKLQVPPLRFAPVGMTKDGVVTFIESCQIGWTEEKPQVPPLRFAPVGMTILFGYQHPGTQTNLSSRPERSVVEGPAVSTFLFR
jgi:hypothetical protein